MFKINIKDSKTGVFIVNFENFSHHVLVFLLLTLSLQLPPVYVNKAVHIAFLYRYDIKKGS